LEQVAARAAAAIVAAEPIDAAVPMLLLRCYLDTGTKELGDALGLALAEALAQASTDVVTTRRAAWLTLLVEATGVADDERILPAVEQLVVALQATWPGHSVIADVSASVEACLRAAELMAGRPIVQDAIDHLERVVGGSYRPGDGLVRERAGVRVRCGLDDHVRGAAALLTAFELTGRLPYSMLAEELVAVAVCEPPADAEIMIQCEAARVLCRLAVLHDDPDYRGAAVIATGADYRAHAARILATQSTRARAGTSSAAAAYGLALRDLLRHVR
jgi:uncharacterized protein YyaL (SSP411 family)